MRVDDLIGYGLPRRAVELWRADGFQTLLPLQVEAIKQYGLLDGRDLLICGPTSSGKTYCGEMAALKTIAENKKAIFLVPLKAIADEKFEDFGKRYRRLKIRTLIVSSDYPQNKLPFLEGKYDIAVVVYEMLNSLTSTNLRALELAGVVVFDEFQVIASIDRGLVYEAVLGKVRYLKQSIQLIALIGGLTECRLFEKWLNIPLLNVSNRPVELHRGVLFNSRFVYRRFNDCQEGVEYFNAGREYIEATEIDSAVPDELVNAISFLINGGEQVLIFVSSRNRCRDLAIALAGIFSVKPAGETITGLDDLPDTMQKKSLTECLKNGMAFHNADLSPTYRRALESGFRSGDIRVMVCTTTLAMGVNLPSKNVFIEPLKYYDSIGGAPLLKPLLRDDYNQIAGRAGRLGKSDSFGRAVIIANDESDREHIRECYLDGSAGLDVRLVDFEKLAWLVLGWICCGIIKDYDDAKLQLKLSLRGYIEGFENKLPTRVIDYLNRHGYITLKGCRLICTPVGKAAVYHNIELNTAAAIRDGFIRHKLDDKLLSWLYYLTDIPECRKSRIYRKSFGFDVSIQEYIRMLSCKYEDEPAGPLRCYYDNEDAPFDASRINTLMLLADIIQPIPAMELERKYQAGWGRLKKIGEFYANILRAATEIGKSEGVTRAQADSLNKYADCLHYGIPQGGLPLMQLNMPGLEREFVLRLLDAGLCSPEAIASCEYGILLSLLPEKLASRLYDASRALITKTARVESLHPDKPRSSLKARNTGSRYEVAIGRQSVLLQPRLYQYLQRLYNSNDPDGWVDKNALDNGLNQVKYIYKLRKACAGIHGFIIESDGAGRYRLRIDELKLFPQTIQAAAKVAEK